MVTTKFSIEGFADDHQVIKHFLVSFQCKALGEDIVKCLQHISKWMNEHFLKLNESKTKILVIAPPKVQQLITIRGIFITNDIFICFVDSAKNLGTELDSILSFENQVNKVVKSSFSGIKDLFKIKRLLTEKEL